VVPASWLQAAADHPVVSVLAMAILAVLLSICSEADAFVAASLTQFSLTARLAFLVVGPMIDVKLFAMQAATFGRGFAVRFAPATFHPRRPGVGPDRRGPAVSREAQAVVLLLLGAALVHASVTDLYLRYVKAGLQPLLLAAGGVLILVALGTICSEWRRHARPSRSQPRTRGATNRATPTASPGSPGCCYLCSP
jgi:Predicted permease